MILGLYLALLLVAGCSPSGRSAGSFGVMKNDWTSLGSLTFNGRKPDVNEFSTICDSSPSLHSTPHANLFWNRRGATGPAYEKFSRQVEHEVERLGYHEIPVPRDYASLNSDGVVHTYVKSGRKLFLYTLSFPVPSGSQKSESGSTGLQVVIQPELDPCK